MPIANNEPRYTGRTSAQISYGTKGIYKETALVSPARIENSPAEGTIIGKVMSSPTPLATSRNDVDLTIVGIPVSTAENANATPTPGQMLGYGQVIVSGQSTLVANKYMAPLTFVSGNNITLTTSASTGQITISSTASSGIQGITAGDGTNSFANTTNLQILGGTAVQSAPGTVEITISGGNSNANGTFDTVTTNNLVFSGTGPININSGNDLNLSAAGQITMNGEPIITLTTLQTVVANSTSFSDFQAQIANL